MGLRPRAPAIPRGMCRGTSLCDSDTAGSGPHRSRGEPPARHLPERHAPLPASRSCGTCAQGYARVFAMDDGDETLEELEAAIADHQRLESLRRQELAEELVRKLYSKECIRAIERNKDWPLPLAVDWVCCHGLEDSRREYDVLVEYERAASGHTTIDAQTAQQAMKLLKRPGRSYLARDVYNAAELLLAEGHSEFLARSAGQPVLYWVKRGPFIRWAVKFFPELHPSRTPVGASDAPPGSMAKKRYVVFTVEPNDQPKVERCDAGEEPSYPVHGWVLKANGRISVDDKPTRVKDGKRDTVAPSENDRKALRAVFECLQQGTPLSDDKLTKATGNTGGRQIRNRLKKWLRGFVEIEDSETYTIRPKKKLTAVFLDET